MAITAPLGGGDSDAGAHGEDMSSRASQWPCPQPPTTASTRWRLEKRTTAHGHRRRTGPRLRTKLHGDRRKEQPGGLSSSSCLRKSPADCGPRLSLSFGRRSGFSGTLWSTSPTSCALLPWCRFSSTCAAEVDNLMDIFRLLDRPMAEQVVAVPKISCSS